MNAVSSDRLAQPIQKDSVIRRAITDKREKLTSGGRPEWASACLVPFSSQLHASDLVHAQGKVTDPERGRLGYTCSRVVEKQQQRVVTHALFGTAIRGSQQSIHLRLVQVREFGPGEALEWNRAHFITPCNVFRTSFGNEARDCTKGGKALVPRAYRTPALLF